VGAAEVCVVARGAAVSSGAVLGDAEASPVAGRGAVSSGAVVGAEACPVAGPGAAVSSGAALGAEACPRTSGAELPGAKAVVVFALVSGAAFAAVLSADAC